MNNTQILDEITAIIDERFRDPKPGSYVSGLVNDEKGIDRVLEKIAEEAGEFIIAVKNGVPERIKDEAADLQFHLLVALRAADIPFDDVLKELENRRK
jgi:phosphoribosyl-ATP pyrophosphohydrolase